ncbi:class A beta-lactamase [Siphonobacter curvatus]|uniref:beta-lactamase n=2 Tax=Siphonobacter curvatus TaxID=2094562 RepID=A0A2S7ILX8_9BACT|nr:class A beta-lactamase [Siphonobacter curvatus]
MFPSVQHFPTMYRLSALLLGLLISLASFGQSSLRKAIQQIAQSSGGTVGVSIIHLERGDTLSLNGTGHFPMLSVYKFPIAIALLNQIEAGKFDLDTKWHVTKKELLSNTHSPIRDKYPQGNVDITIRELIENMVALSDNNACDIILRKLGGTKVVENYFHHLGYKNIAIRATEEEMATEWSVQYQNWCEPVLMGRLLNDFYEGKLLNSAYTKVLKDIMLSTSTAPNRLPGLLPKGTPIARKTGTSGTSPAGVTAATNDVGVITLPSGQHLVVAVFVMDSKAETAVREQTIARIAKAAYDHYNQN